MPPTSISTTTSEEFSAKAKVLKDVIEQLRPKNLLLVCAGTFELPAFEDIFAAGALVDELAQELPPDALSDSAHHP